MALLRRLVEERSPLGIELSVIHVHHGIRGAAADEDAAFTGELARTHQLPFHLHRVDALSAAKAQGETLEEAARNLRYACFRAWMQDGHADAVATAHTLDDQAETVLHKMIRGAWTEGLSGIHPVLQVAGGLVLRPFLENSHVALQAWLRTLPQKWQEDETNQDTAYTRNRIRLQLLPLLHTFNPQIGLQLARLASIAADEETYWEGELRRLLPSLLLSGRPVRGGGRSSSTHPEEGAIAIELVRLRELPRAVGRRVVRAAARQLGARLSFEQTERILALMDAPAAPARAARFDLSGELRVERSLREIRLTRAGSADPSAPGSSYPFQVPGEIVAPEYGVVLRGEGAPCAATLRAWKPGDRVTLRHSLSSKKVADVLDRLRVLGDARKTWPVIESEGRIVWMRGVDIEGGTLRITEGSWPVPEGPEKAG